MIQLDPQQQLAFSKFEILKQALEQKKRSFLFQKPILGLYLWGGVGRGKTFLMDMFFNELKIEKKTRYHFHRFMKMVHQNIQANYGHSHAIEKLAKHIAKTTKLLCLDEFYVEDVADAMILSNLIKALIACKVILVMTSNIPPNQLYLGGLQRVQFLSAIEALEHHLTIHNLDSQTDYRFIHAADTQNNTLSKVFDEWSNTLHPEEIIENSYVIIEGRKIRTLKHTEKVIWFRFTDLCGYARGTTDYIYLANHYHVILLDQVPLLEEETDNEARRFIAFIDECYDNQIILILHLNDNLTLHTLYQGNKLKFAFDRTISRITEMQTPQYIHYACQLKGITSS